HPAEEISIPVPPLCSRSNYARLPPTHGARHPPPPFVAAPRRYAQPNQPNPVRACAPALDRSLASPCACLPVPVRFPAASLLSLSLSSLPRLPSSAASRHRAPIPSSSPTLSPPPSRPLSLSLLPRRAPLRSDSSTARCRASLPWGYFLLLFLVARRRGDVTRATLSTEDFACPEIPWGRADRGGRGRARGRRP
ncbi:hypothetical protein EJB05_55488, partial [Eragrostis curvula]